jgi:signal transduction histidine kinase
MASRSARAGLVALVAAVVVAGVHFSGEATPWGSRLLGMSLLLAAAGALWWSDRAPVPVLVVTGAAAVAYFVAGGPPGPEPVPFVVALYGVARAGYRRIAIPAVPVTMLAIVAADQWTARMTGDPAEGGDLVAVAAVLVAAVALGELARARDGQRRAMRERAAADERLRIARELHDTLAHQLTVISVQAAGALRRRQTRPELAYPTLETIRQVAGDALTELRQVLGVLRAGAEPALTPPAGAPARGLAGVSGLATQAGVEARVTVSGEAGPLPSTVEHVAYRIIQEALTNVARHSGTTQAEVRLHYGRDDLLIEVLDRGRGGDPAGGFGLAGMRERVGELGGELTVGARAGGGFAVRVRLPLTKAKVEAA